MSDDELVERYARLYAAHRTFLSFAEERIAHPGDDLASAMLTLTDPDGRRALSNDHALAFTSCDDEHVPWFATSAGLVPRKGRCSVAYPTTRGVE